MNDASHHQPELSRYLEDGDLLRVTNDVEREIRPLVIDRRIDLYLGHARTGATARVMSAVLQSARL